MPYESEAFFFAPLSPHIMQVHIDKEDMLCHWQFCIASKYLRYGGTKQMLRLVWCKPRPYYLC